MSRDFLIKLIPIVIISIGAVVILKPFLRSVFEDKVEIFIYTTIFLLITYTYLNLSFVKKTMEELKANQNSIKSIGKAFFIFLLPIIILVLGFQWLVRYAL